MSQNRSHAVMAQRSEPHDSLDDFPTPPWATRALCELLGGADHLEGLSCWEPACNRGYMVRPLEEYFRRVWASDVHDYSLDPGAGDAQERVVDFLFPGSESPNIAAQGVDWIITNPPFRLAEQFIERARDIARVGVAMLVRMQFLEGTGRYKRLFSKNPPNMVAQFVERVPMVKGRYDPKASTATAYCWLIWFQGIEGTAFEWIPPCRKALERESDYPDTTTPR